ncbi:hypothetical protein BE08_31545 [Sorangium cellulosum]|uniref:Uncharacterized protein n=1 Tax=Sorangium cellulosum TaxID=56 RepID=A0A150PGI6_SORCE|nr:hypothetical protein BE08_31545 [Sorangium cellulosum]
MIFFRFRRSSTDERRSQILDELRAMEDVLNVGRLFPSRQGDLTYFVHVAKGGDAERVAAYIARLPEVEDVEIQPNYPYIP